MSKTRPIDRLRAGMDWILKNPAAALTILVAVFYSAHRFRDRMFYGRIGVAPEEIGRGYVETLGDLGDVLGGSVLIGLISGLAWHVGTAVPSMFMPRGRSLESAASTAWESVVAGFFVGVVAFVVLELVYSLLTPVLLKHPLDQGAPAFYSAKVLASVRAEPVVVHWLTRDRETDTELTQNKQLLFLGSADGIYVLYNRESKEVIRMPTSSVMLTVRRE